MTVRWRVWALYAAAWVPVAIGYAGMLRRTREVSAAASIEAACTYAIVAALLGAIVWHGSARMPWPGRPHLSFMIAQVVMAAAYSVAWYAATLAQLAARIGMDGAIRVSELFGPWQLLAGLWVYGLIAGLSHALRATGRQRERDVVAARADLLRMRAETQALRGELSPRFLFSALNTVSAVVRRGGQSADFALERYARLLRYVLDAKRLEGDDVTLAEELSFVRDYLSLEQRALGERLTVVEQIDDEAMACMLPPLTLQPIVENAITHAIAPRTASGTITIGASLEGGKLILVISDDGPGAVEEGVRSAQGLGLRAGRQRLETRYPRAARFTVTTAPGAGFTVTLTLPVRMDVTTTNRLAVAVG